MPSFQISSLFAVACVSAGRGRGGQIEVLWRLGKEKGVCPVELRTA